MTFYHKMITVELSVVEAQNLLNMLVDEIDVTEGSAEQEQVGYLKLTYTQRAALLKGLHHRIYEAFEI